LPRSFPGQIFCGGSAAAIRGIRDSGQIQITGADHVFAGMEDELVRRARQFLGAQLML